MGSSPIIRYVDYGLGLAQLVEHLFCSQKAVGSSPTSGIHLFCFVLGIIFFLKGGRVVECVCLLNKNTVVSRVRIPPFPF